MRKLIIFCCLLLSLLGCSKKQQKRVIDDSIIGTWKAIEHFTSPGSGGTWNAVPFLNQFTITFNNDGTFSYSANFPKADLKLDTYVLSGTQISVSSQLNSNAENWYIGIVDNQVMHLQIFSCIEGCPYKLIPVE